MGVLDKAKAAAGRATTKAQEGVATMQTKRKLTQAYGELGQTTYELVQGGELTDPRLSPTVERISAVKEQLERAERTGRAPALGGLRARDATGVSDAAGPVAARLPSSRLRQTPLAALLPRGTCASAAPGVDESPARRPGSRVFSTG